MSRWRNRWASAQESLLTAEREQSDRELEALFRGVLKDLHRNGGVTKFVPKQVAQIIAIACEKPAESDLPVTHWTAPDLAREAAKRGIVKSISARQVSRFLKERKATATQEPLLAHVAGQARRPRAVRGRSPRRLRHLPAGA